MRIKKESKKIYQYKYKWGNLIVNELEIKTERVNEKGKKEYEIKKGRFAGNTRKITEDRIKDSRISFYHAGCYGEIIMFKRDDELAKQKFKEAFEEYKKATLEELEITEKHTDKITREMIKEGYFDNIKYH